MPAEKQRVLIELRYRVRALFLTETNPHYPVSYPLRFVYEGVHPVTVEIEPISEDLVQQPQDRHDAVATAQGKFTASPGVGAMLQNLAVGKVPKGTKNPEPSVRFPDGPLFDRLSRVVSEGWSVPLDLLPESLQSFICQSLGEVRDYLVRTIRVMRWRQDSEGPHSPFAHIRSEFSLEGKTWHPLPVSFSADGWSHGSLSFRGNELDDVAALVRGGADEPFSFELYREAWNQFSTNPRSALLLGVAAVEVGFKECVAALVPDAAWLAREAPTPPVVRMLIEYLPTLPAANRIDGKVVPPPQQHLDRLRRAVNARNQLAHRGEGSSPTGRDLRLLLVDIKEILWLLAYYGGSPWALRHLSLETRQALGDHLTPNEQRILATS